MSWPNLVNISGLDSSGNHGVLMLSVSTLSQSSSLIRASQSTASMLRRLSFDVHIIPGPDDVWEDGLQFELAVDGDGSCFSFLGLGRDAMQGGVTI